MGAAWVHLLALAPFLLGAISMALAGASRSFLEVVGLVVVAGVLFWISILMIGVPG